MFPSWGMPCDGKSDWKAFYAKFSRYAEVSEWTEGECRDQLYWCLDGKASEYYVLLMERNHDMAHKDLIMKIDKRFAPMSFPCADSISPISFFTLLSSPVFAPMPQTLASPPL
jgi:hypothetical protein